MQKPPVKCRSKILHCQN